MSGLPRTTPARAGKKSSDGKYRLRMRVSGYADGLAGRPAKHTDASYQQCWRRGREARNGQA